MQEDDPRFTRTLPSQEGEGEPARGERADTSLGPGDFVGRYRIRECIGEGGMGVVYAAEDRELGRVVAIKLLHPVVGIEAEGQRRRMLREAQALARVSHRNLVMVFDVGSREGRIWIAMEYVAGETLETWLTREHRSWAEIVGVLAEAARGLAAVHAAGLVHRDFKPGNVIVRPDGMVQVLDFGLAVRMNADEQDREQERPLAPPDLDALAATLTTTGAFMGTPAYMAPEQFGMCPTDGRTDQFSLCVALYEALYGHRPFKGRDISELMLHTMQGLTQLPPQMPGLPLSVRQVLLRGLAADPGDRFVDMQALVEALDATRAPMAKAVSGWRRFGMGMVVGGAVLAVGAGVWISQADVDDADTAPPPATTPDPPVPTETPKTQRPAPRPEAPRDKAAPAALPSILDTPADVSPRGDVGSQAPPMAPSSVVRTLPKPLDRPRPTTDAGVPLPSVEDPDDADDPDHEDDDDPPPAGAVAPAVDPPEE